MHTIVFLRCSHVFQVVVARPGTGGWGGSLVEQDPQSKRLVGGHVVRVSPSGKTPGNV